MNGTWRRLVMGVMLTTGGLWAQTPAAPAPAPTIRNSTVVPAAPVKAGDDRGRKGETPLNTPAEEPAIDATPATSPLPPGARGGYFLPGTLLELQLARPIDSGRQHNGDAVLGVLLSAVKAANGKMLPKGTPVQVTVVSAAPAGGMESYGVLSLQADLVGGVGVYTNVLDFNGQEGHKDLPDSAPAKGTEAMVNQGTMLRFTVQGAGDNFDQITRPGEGGGGRAGSAGSPVSGVSPALGVNGGAPGTTPGSGASTPTPQTTQPH